MATPLLIAKLLVNLPAVDREWARTKLPPGTVAGLADAIEAEQLTASEFRLMIRFARERWPDGVD